jgi:hypothetical protein
MIIFTGREITNIPNPRFMVDLPIKQIDLRQIKYSGYQINPVREIKKMFTL